VPSIAVLGKSLTGFAQLSNTIRTMWPLSDEVGRQVTAAITALRERRAAAASGVPPPPLFNAPAPSSRAQATAPTRARTPVAKVAPPPANDGSSDLELLDPPPAGATQRLKAKATPAAPAATARPAAAGTKARPIAARSAAPNTPSADDSNDGANTAAADKDKERTAARKKGKGKEVATPVDDNAGADAPAQPTKAKRALTQSGAGAAPGPSKRSKKDVPALPLAVTIREDDLDLAVEVLKTWDTPVLNNVLEALMTAKFA
jgi:hypothetical protein